MFKGLSQKHKYGPLKVGNHNKKIPAIEFKAARITN